MTGLPAQLGSVALLDGREERVHVEVQDRAGSGRASVMTGRDLEHTATRGRPVRRRGYDARATAAFALSRQASEQKCSSTPAMRARERARAGHVGLADAVENEVLDPGGAAARGAAGRRGAGPPRRP